jgi:fructokinase
VAKLDLTYLQVAPTAPTGTVSVTLDAQGSPEYCIHQPVAWDEIALTPELLALAPRASVVYFGTLVQRQEVSRATLRGFVEAASTECVRVCDVNLRAPFGDAEVLRWSLGRAHILKVSDQELPELARLLGEQTLQLACHQQEADELTTAAGEAARALLRLAPQCRLVAITLGPHGSLLADRQRVHRHQGFPVQVVDTIGAGDAFTAGLVHAFTRGAGLEAINAVSNLCGSYVASQQGATPELPASLLASIEDALSGGVPPSPPLL